MCRLTKCRHVLRDMSKESFKRDVQEFDPEDPKVWEQADQELKQASASRDLFGNYFRMPGICWAVLSLPLVYVVFKFCERLFQ